MRSLHPEIPLTHSAMPSPHEDFSAIQLELELAITTTVRGRAVDQRDDTDPMHGKK